MPAYNKVEMCADYRANLSTPQIAKKHGLSISVVRKILLRNGVKMRTRRGGILLAADRISASNRGIPRPKSPETKDALRQAALRRSSRGYSFKTGSYVAITNGKNKHRNQHRVMMEEFVGRRLSFNEVVHHKDGNKHNNNLSNLEVMSRSQHTSLHRRQLHGII